MKTKTTRLVDPQGRVSLPGYLRELVGISPGDTVIVEIGDDNSLHIQAIGGSCCICGERHNASDMLAIGRDNGLCTKCARAIVAKFTSEEDTH